MKLEGEGTKPRIGIVNIERRRYPRFSIDLPIEYHPIPLSAFHKGRTINASEGGLLVYLPERMEIGQFLNVKLFFSSGFNLSTIEVIAEVVWIDIHLDKDWGDYRTGLKFVDISDEDLSRLKDFLTSLSR
jgi:c-di-GMP-binding flagellar brake protein YcgR